MIGQQKKIKNIHRETSRKDAVMKTQLGQFDWPNRGE